MATARLAREMLEENEEFTYQLADEVRAQMERNAAMYGGYQGHEFIAYQYNRLQQEMDTIARAIGNLAARLSVTIVEEDEHA